VENNPLISVLMPAYNCELYIQQAIDSILNQSYTNWELLVADDGSSDKTKEIIQSYKDERIKCFHNSENQGYLKTSNKLVNESKGEFITFQDADDYSDKFRLEKLLERFEEDKELMMLGSCVMRFDDNNWTQKLEFKTSYNDIREALPNRFECIGSALMVRKQVITEFGLYHDFFDRIGSEDLYWFGIIASKYKTENLEDVLYHYRDNPHSVTNNVKGNVKKMMGKEFAIYGVQYFIKNKAILFDNYCRKIILEKFLVGKGWCWQKLYPKGLWYISQSILLNPFVYFERYELIRIYLPKLVKK
jgi:glycosyltransferase involved in cell wall biosynthesis